MCVYSRWLLSSNSQSRFLLCCQDGAAGGRGGGVTLQLQLWAAAMPRGLLSNTTQSLGGLFSFIAADR